MRAEPPPWRPPRLVASPSLRWALALGAVAYVAVALGSFDVDWGRVREGLPRGVEFVAAFARPDFASRWTDVEEGILESLAMTVVATAAGAVLALPLALGAARNLAPAPIYAACRAVVAFSRSLQEVVLAVFFVVLFGFGPLAGVLTLTLGSVGFLAKLLAEAIETVDPAPLEAIRATGASWAQVVVYAVLPQVAPRIVGLTAYRLDINFRESAVIGVVGAGGIGSTLQTAFGRYEWGTAAGILLLIIAIVLAGEVFSGRLRRSFV